MLAFLIASIMIGGTETAWQWREMWTVEMETAWLLARQAAQQQPESEAMDDVSFGITGMLYTRSIDARRTPREILKYRFEDPLKIAKCLEGFNVWRIYQPLWEP